MPTARFGISFEAAGISTNKQITRTADGLIGAEVTLGVASALSSWVKTDANTAAGVLAGGHGLTDGTYDVYWTGGRRYGVTVVISTNAVALDLGSGTDYPASGNTTVVMRKQQTVNVAIDGDAVGAVCIVMESTDSASTEVGHITLKDAAADVITELDLAANVPLAYDITGGQTNPFTGDAITVAYATRSGSSATPTVTLKIMGVQDVTP